MIVQASGSGMGVGRFTRPLRGVAVPAMPDATLDTMQRVESVWVVPLGAFELRLLVPGMAVAEIIDHRYVADRVEVTC